ncbi:MAG: FAD/NAD(P)-binding protein [Cyclobacteriaceae bacterium]
MTNNQSKIAIIGMGPRGMTSLERLLEAFSKDDLIQSAEIILLEEKEGQLGNSHVYALDQPDTNWINISNRALTSMPERPDFQLRNKTIKGFPDYASWTGDIIANRGAVKMDIYCPRSHMGKYIRARFDSLFEQIKSDDQISIYYERVNRIDHQQDSFEIATTSGQTYTVDEVLLTIGHQPTKTSDQIKEWTDHAKDFDNLFLFPSTYPIDHLMKNPEIYHQAVVGVRGFGLAMIDVARALTIGLGGEFKVTDEASRRMSYHPSGKEPKTIVPFSLDGLPAACKPLNDEIDGWFEPHDTHREKLQKTVRSAIANKEAVAHITFFRKLMAEISSDIYQNLGEKGITHELSLDELHQLTYNWLTDEETTHKLIVDRDQSPVRSMEAFADMSTGHTPVSLDYCVGQVWRQLQPLMYVEFAFCGLQPGVMAELIALDERIKRYSYGVPVESLRQMVALAEAGILITELVDDPDIRPTKEGWEIEKNGTVKTATVMIDSVLDNPVLTDVDAEIINSLQEDQIIQPLHEDLGVLTTKDACVITKAKGDKIPLAITGRLAKGVLLGTDAILECFTDPVTWWAEGVADRLRQGDTGN